MNLWKRIVAALCFLLTRLQGEPIVTLVVTPKAANWHKFIRIEHPVPPLPAGPFDPGGTFDISHKGTAIVNAVPNHSYTPPIRIAHLGGRTVTDVRLSSIHVDGEQGNIHVYGDGESFVYQYVLEFGPIDTLCKRELKEPMTWARRMAIGVPFDKQVYVQPMSSEVSVSDVLDTALFRVFREMECGRESGQSGWKRGDPNDYPVKLSYRDGYKEVSQVFTLRFEEKNRGGRGMRLLDESEANNV